MFIAHGALAYILNEKIQEKEIQKLSKGEHLWIGLLAFLFGILPDVDILVLTMTSTPAFAHHMVFSHSILFWVLMWILLWIFIQLLKKTLNGNTRKVLNDRFLGIVHMSFIIAVMSHLFADILFGYARVLYPLERQFTLLGNIFSPSYFTGYVYSPATVVEILVIVIFVYFVYRNFFRESNIVKYSIYTLFVLSSVLLLFTAYMNLNTYNKTLHIVDGQVVYDIDFDGRINYLDPDTNGSGVNNIEDADLDIVANSIEEILEGNYFATTRSNLWDEIKFRYGAFNSYRLISQSYYNQIMPIEPVLLYFAREKYELRQYRTNMRYIDLLYEYFNDSGRLIDFDSNMVNRGKIFFVVDEKENIQNIGIFLGGERVGIVLDGDSRLVEHRLESVLNEYDGYLFRVQE